MRAFCLPRQFKLSAVFRLCFPGMRTELSCNIETNSTSPLLDGDRPSSDVVKTTLLPRAHGDILPPPKCVEEAPTDVSS